MTLTMCKEDICCSVVHIVVNILKHSLTFSINLVDGYKVPKVCQPVPRLQEKSLEVWMWSAPKELALKTRLDTNSSLEQYTTSLWWRLSNIKHCVSIFYIFKQLLLFELLYGRNCIPNICIRSEHSLTWWWFSRPNRNQLLLLSRLHPCSSSTASQHHPRYRHHSPICCLPHLLILSLYRYHLL